jgi:hypothetical protein
MKSPLRRKMVKRGVCKYRQPFFSNRQLYNSDQFSLYAQKAVNVLQHHHNKTSIRVGFTKYVTLSCKIIIIISLRNQDWSFL